MKLIGSRVLINFGSKPVKTRYSVLSSKSAQNWYYSLYSVYTTVVKHHQSEIIWVGGFEDRKNSSAGADSPDTCRTRSDNHDNHETSTNSWYSDGCERNTLVSTPGWTYGSPYEDVWHYLGPWICKTLQTCEPTACRTAKTSVALPLVAVAIISKGNKSAKQRDVWRCLEAQRPKVTVQASNYQRYWP